eukprot:SM000023S07543  [mRNA]  locus=s23:21999:22890:- [translate_table: standard]
MAGAVRLMMYGFGDDPDPAPETVELVEDILVECITEMIHKAQELGSRRGKMATEDILFLIRKADGCVDHRELHLWLAMNEELKKARKAFEVDEESLAEAT